METRCLATLSAVRIGPTRHAFNRRTCLLAATYNGTPISVPFRIYIVMLTTSMPIPLGRSCHAESLLGPTTRAGAPFLPSAPSDTFLSRFFPILRFERKEIRDFRTLFAVHYSDEKKFWPRNSYFLARY